MSEHDIADRQGLRHLIPQIWQASSASVAARAATDAPVGGVSCRLGDASCASAHATTLSRSASSQRPALQRSLLRLQRQYGNRYVGEVLRQAGVSAHGGCGMDAIERSIDQARGGGQAMDHRTRTRMEGAFAADFSGVRIHTDTRADGLSQALSARAFATGRDVFFRQGEYNPGTSVGRELLAHELTHVVQQNGDGVHRKMTVSQPGDPLEIEADQMARAVMQREHGPAIDRQMVPAEEEEEQPVATKRAADFLQRQPEAPKPEDEAEKKLHAQRDPTVVRRDDEAPTI